jgi:hypothetical protein
MKRWSKYLAILLSAVLAFSLTLTSVSASSSTRYAYSVGVDHGFVWPWSNELEGDFTKNVDYASIAYGMISGVTSYKNYEPTYQYMRGNNPNTGTPRMSSAILFFNGHANYDHIAFNHNNSYGDYATGVYYGYDYDSPTSGYKYAGLLSYDMSTVELVSFVGCSTAAGPTNLTTRAVAQGAKTAVGFSADIHSRFNSGPDWLKKYHDALANGHTVSEAVNYATNSHPNSDLGDYAVIQGSQSTRISSSRTKTLSLADYGTQYSANIPVQLRTLMEYNGERLNKVNKLLDGLILKLQEINPAFEPEHYVVTAQEYVENEGVGVIKLWRYIGEVRTSSVYLAFVNNGIIDTISDRTDAATKKKGLSEKAILEKVEKFKASLNTNRILSEIAARNQGDSVNIVNAKERYEYDEATGELFYVLDYTLEYEKLDGVRSAEEYRVKLN